MATIEIPALPNRTKNERGTYTASFDQNGYNRNGIEIDWTGLDLSSFMDNPQMFYNHNIPVGTFTVVSANDRGEFEVEFIFNDSKEGRDMEKRFVERSMNAFSTTIHFRTSPEVQQVDDETRRVSGQFEMLEISLVDIPAYEKGTVKNSIKNYSENGVSDKDIQDSKNFTFYAEMDRVHESVVDLGGTIKNSIQKEIEDAFKSIQSSVLQECKNQSRADKVVKENGYTPPSKRIANKKNEIVRRVLNRLNSQKGKKGDVIKNALLKFK